MSIPRIAGYPMPAFADFPDNRVQWTPDPARAVLLVHDLQEYFLDFYDSSAAPIPELLANAQALRKACDAAGIPVVYTAQPPQQSDEDRGLLNEFWGPGLPARPERAHIVAALAPRPQDVVLTKWRYSAFVRSDLRERMRTWGRDQLIVCGVYAHIGVLMSCGDAFMQDVQAILVGDAVADFSAERHAMALEYVAQRCGVVRSTEQVCSALQPSAGLASIEALRAEVASVLELSETELGLEDNLMYSGLDSIRLMSLVERWRGFAAQHGRELSFVDLAEQPTLNAWWNVLRKAA
jgi:bifunctional isochorismate lyase / aryl carrier protein